MHNRDVVQGSEVAHCRDVYRCEVRRYVKAFVITAAILCGQFVVAWYSGSLVLLSDTVHVGSDLTVIAASLIVAAVAAYMNEQREERVRTLFGYAGIALLVVGAFYVWGEAHERLITPRHVASEWVLLTGIIGGVGNYAVHHILHSVPGAERTTTHEVLDAHVLSDLMLSIVVVLSAFATMFFGWSKFDPIGSIAIAGYMLFLAGRLSGRIGTSHHIHHHSH